jgi:hypothetical protein
MSIRCLRWVCLPGAPLRHGDVLTTPGWMVPTWSKTVDYRAKQRFPPQEVIHRPVSNGKIRAEHQLMPQCDAGPAIAIIGPVHRLEFRNGRCTYRVVEQIGLDKARSMDGTSPKGER